MGPAVALITDLFFTSRISAAARKASRQVRFVRSAPELDGIEEPSVVLVDLDADVDVIEMIRVIAGRGWAASIIAFGPHLDTVKRKAARAAGADRVLAKSKFVTELPRIMEGQQTSGNTQVDAALQELREYADRMTQLAGLLRDPDKAPRIVFAPDPHMEVAIDRGDAIVLDSADYLGFLAVDALRSKLTRLRELEAADSATNAGVE